MCYGSLVREKQNFEAIDVLGSAAHLDPANARYTYVYGVALNDSGRTAEAIDALEANIERHPYDRESLSALVTFLTNVGNLGQAQKYAQRLEELGENN
jgi:Flp pilus assembly protein TadD